jgi:hypothetical protein
LPGRRRRWPLVCLRNRLARGAGSRRLRFHDCPLERAKENAGRSGERPVKGDGLGGRLPGEVNDDAKAACRLRLGPDRAAVQVDDRSRDG